MQAQYTVASSSCPSSLAYYHHISEAYSTAHDQYFPTGGDNYPGSFSRGSSDTLAYPTDEAYHYMTDRGGPSSADHADLGNTAHMSTAYAAATTTTTSIGFDATGIGYTDNVIPPVCLPGREYHHPEDIRVPYDQGRGWEWECQPTTLQPTLPPPHHPHPHPLTHQHLHAPTLPQLPNTMGASALLPHDPTFLDLTSAIKSAVSTVGQAQQPYPVQSSSPVAQLPTPASMYVSLNSGGGGGRVREETPQISVGGSPAAVAAAVNLPPPIIQMPPGAADATAVMPVPDMLSREKKHACTMCHKRFDRPSTLRKHLLVHTGEKAFVCDTCGRRFGVASNLNRHVRRCILKPVNAALANTQAPPPPPGSSSIMPSDMPSSNQHDVPTVKAAATKRGRASSSSESASSTSTSSSSQTHGAKCGVDGTGSTRPPGQKRRRRAPSPSLWIPWSLRAFNLACEEFHRSTPVPLPPVRRNLPREERDSWDDNVSTRPYHPHEWRGVLPGPGLGHGFGLGAKDIQNVNFGGSGGIMLGRVLVF